LKRCTNARDGRSVTSAPVFLLRYVVVTCASSAGAIDRFSLPTLAPVDADAPSAMHVNWTAAGE
jgi:hypothetical protein